MKYEISLEKLTNDGWKDIGPFGDCKIWKKGDYMKLVKDGYCVFEHNADPKVYDKKSLGGNNEKTN